MAARGSVHPSSAITQPESTLAAASYWITLRCIAGWSFSYVRPMLTAASSWKPERNPGVLFATPAYDSDASVQPGDGLERGEGAAVSTCMQGRDANVQLGDGLVRGDGAVVSTCMQGRSSVAINVPGMGSMHEPSSCVASEWKLSAVAEVHPRVG